VGIPVQLFCLPAAEEIGYLAVTSYPFQASVCFQAAECFSWWVNFRNPLLKIPFRYGLIGGAIGCIVIAALYYMGRHPFLLPLIFDFRIVIFAVFIFFSLKELRDNHLEGTLYFWQGMAGSYVFIITSALVGAVFSWCFATWNQKFLPSYVQKLQQQMVDFKDQIITSVGADAYHQQLAKLPLTTALDMAGDYLLKSLIIGLFLAIIMSVILRKQPKTQ
jgi:hypothetical protein